MRCRLFVPMCAVSVCHTAQLAFTVRWLFGAAFAKSLWPLVAKNYRCCKSFTLHVTGAGTREVAYAYAVRSAAVAYAVTQACSLGNIIGCGCDKSMTNSPLFNRVAHRRFRVNGQRRDGASAVTRSSTTAAASGVFQWGGCSADVRYGLRFSRVFLDSREVEEDSRSLMNLHNNRAGRKVRYLAPLRSLSVCTFICLFQLHVKTADGIMTILRRRIW